MTESYIQHISMYNTCMYKHGKDVGNSEKNHTERQTFIVAQFPNVLILPVSNANQGLFLPLN